MCSAVSICAAGIQAFHEHYYNTFDSNRGALAGLYQENAILTFEGQKFQGQATLMQKLTSLPFQQVWPVMRCSSCATSNTSDCACWPQVKHHISSVDAQPSLSNGLIVFITGQLLVMAPTPACWIGCLLCTEADQRYPCLKTEGEANPLRFSQVFHLAATGGSFVITNGTALPQLGCL